MRNNLIVFAVMSAIVAYAAWANAEEPCERAAYLAGEIEDGLIIIDELIEMARPVCAEKALARDCARQRIEIRARLAEVKQLETLRRAAAAKCKAGTATRKANAS